MQNFSNHCVEYCTEFNSPVASQNIRHKQHIYVKKPTNVTPFY